MKGFILKSGGIKATINSPKYRPVIICLIYSSPIGPPIRRNVIPVIPTTDMPYKK